VPEGPFPVPATSNGACGFPALRFLGAGENAQLPKHIREWTLPITRPGHLVPTAEKATDGVIEMQFHIVPRLRH
jgi:hypothetical protein